MTFSRQPRKYRKYIVFKRLIEYGKLESCLKLNRRHILDWSDHVWNESDLQCNSIRPPPPSMMSLRESHREVSSALCSFAYTAMIYHGRTTAYLGSQCWLHLLTMCVSHTGPAVSTMLLMASRTLLQGFLNGQGTEIPPSIAENLTTFATPPIGTRHQPSI